MNFISESVLRHYCAYGPHSPTLFDDVQPPFSPGTSRSSHPWKDLGKWKSSLWLFIMKSLDQIPHFKNVQKCLYILLVVFWFCFALRSLSHFVLDLPQVQQIKLTTGGKNFPNPNRARWLKFSREDRDHGLAICRDITTCWLLECCLLKSWLLHSVLIKFSF